MELDGKTLTLAQVQAIACANEHVRLVLSGTPKDVVGSECVYVQQQHHEPMYDDVVMPIEWVRAGMVVHLNALIRDPSVSPALLQLLCAMLNHDITPCIREFACKSNRCMLTHLALTISDDG